MHTSIATIVNIKLGIHKYSVCFVHVFSITVLSRASTHGRSQLKPEKSGVGGYTEDLKREGLIYI